MRTMNRCLWIMVAGLWASTGQALLPPSPQASLNTCQYAVKTEGKKFVQNYVNAVGTCLQKVSTDIVKNNLSKPSTGTATTCVTQFRKLYDSRGLGKQLSDKLAAAITKKCEPGQPRVAHTLNDILGTGAGVSQPLKAERIGNWCGGFRNDAWVFGDGKIDTLDEWIDCVVNSHLLVARTAVTVQYPRAAEWALLVWDAMGGVSPPSGDPNKVSDALEGLSAFYEAVHGVLGVEPLTQAGTQFPASGQRTSYGTGTDGHRRAGAKLRYKDNGDGTVTDLNTQLMWEKKDDNNAGRVHDWNNTYTWTAGTTAFDGTVVTVFLDRLNNKCDGNETTACTANSACTGIGNGLCGHAGHRDWRIPNVKELQSIIDYERYDPAVDPVFDTSCAAGCTVTSCSCTQSLYYWSATSYVPLPDGAWGVSFGTGGVGYNVKTGYGDVRAVRGGL